MEFYLTNYQFNILKNKAKIYSYLGNLLSKTCFKVSEGKFDFLIRDKKGLLQTSFDIDYSGESVYFSVDLNKWQTALQKYENAEKIKLSLTKNTLKLCSNASDVINLGVTYFDADSSEALILDTFVEKKRPSFIDKEPLVLTEDVVDSLALADSFFSYQTTSNVNSVGLGRDTVIYSDKSLVLKVNLSETLPEKLFELLPQDESFIYIPTFLIKLLSLLYKTGDKVYFSEDYKIIFWEDDDSVLLLVLDLKKIALPTPEQFNSIKPTDTSLGFEVDSSVLKEGLGFFTGFYEGSVWKPINISMIENKEVALYYKHPTAEVNKVLDGVASNINGTFTIDSESLKKYVFKVADKLPSEKIFVNYDEESLGVYLNTANKYELVLLKLEED